MRKPRQPKTALDLRAHIITKGFHAHLIIWGRYAHWMLLTEKPKKPCKPGRCLKVGVQR